MRLSARKCGGPSRNRTGVQGFAVLCVTTPPSGLAGQAFGGTPCRLSTEPFDKRVTHSLGGESFTGYAALEALLC